MHSTHLRNKHIHGVLLGVAVGEALGYARSGLSRRGGLSLYGRTPLQYQFLPGKGVYGENTRLMLINAQALLNSRSEMSNLRPAFSWRLSWYLLSLPYGTSRAIWLAALRSWLMRLKLDSGVRSQTNRALTRAIFCGPAVHGTGHRLPRWAEAITKFTHKHPRAINCGKVVAMLADYSSTNADSFDSLSALEEILGHAGDGELKEKLEQLAPFLEQQRGPRAVARHFGWPRKISMMCIPTTVMSVYCFLRYPDDYRRAVESAILLGGDSATLGAVTGGLSGARLGAPGIPEELASSLGGSPHGPAWIDMLGKRFSHWPHGSEDLYMAPGQPSDPLFQLARNLSTYPLGLAQFVKRLPYKLKR